MYSSVVAHTQTGEIDLPAWTETLLFRDFMNINNNCVEASYAKTGGNVYSSSVATEHST